MKKVFSIVICILLMASVFVGCGGGEDPNEEVTLKWAIPTYQQKDFDMVQEEVNKLLAGLLPNTKLDLEYDSSMGNKWALWMSGQQVIDIAHAGYVNDLWTEIDKSSYLELDDLIHKYAPTIEAEMEGIYKAQYDTARVGGKLYAIPNIQIYINDTPALQIPESLFEYLDVKALRSAIKKSPYSNDEIYQVVDNYLQAVYASGKVGKGFVGPHINISGFLNIIAKRGYAFIGGSGVYASSNLCYKVFDTDQSTIKIEDFYKTQEFLTLTKWARKWFNNGYISKDVLTNVMSSANTTPVISCAKYDMSKADENGIYFSETSIADMGSYYMVSVAEKDQLFVGENNIGSLQTYTTIPFTSEHPERAIQLLELLRTEKGAPLLNMICYGIEGVHYEKLSDTEIKAFDYNTQGSSGSNYGIQNWMVGTHMNQYVIYPYTEQTRTNAKKYYEEDYAKCHRTPIAGFTFDMKPYKSDLANVDAVSKEYVNRIAYGADANYENLYKEMCSKMETAGINKLIKNLQSQADEYIKSNK